MEKENIAWLIIRALGIYIGFEAFTKFIGLNNYYFIFTALYEKTDSSQWAEYELTEIWIRFFFSVLIFIVYTAMSYYCLRKGNFLHKLILFKQNEDKT